LMSNDQPRRQPFLSNQFISEISGQIHPTANSAFR
jgi:hypothetical protein